MNRLHLLLRNLLYFRGVNLAVIAGMAVATAVLTGALMVGDSVRGSLQALALQRLGPVDEALIAPRFFEQTLAARLSSAPQITGRYDITPGVITRGGLASDAGGTRTGGVQIGAVGGDLVPVPPNTSVINQAAADALELKNTGGGVIAFVPADADAPREATLSRRDRSNTLNSLRTIVAKIEAHPGFAALFDPNGGQRVPQNAWLNLADLQDAVGERGRINVMLAHDRQSDSSASHGNESAALLNQALRQVIQLEDCGLRIEPAGDGKESALTSRQTYLDPSAVAAAEAVAREASLPLRHVTVNLINSVTRSDAAGPSPKTLHYAVAAGVTPLDETALADDEVALNEWTAQQLGAKTGDRVHITYYDRQNNGDLAEIGEGNRGFKEGFRVARILPMAGIGADKSLTPNYKGLTDADSVSDWDPPEGVNIDKTLVTKADEAYWHQYRAAPKLFFGFETARKLWGTAYGDVTSLRVPEDKATAFREQLLARIDPASMGMVFRPIKAEQLAAAGGSTDFAGLFIGFSFFLIVAAALLVAMLFRLNVEQRARQLGLLSAVGFAPGSLRRLALGEGMLLAIVGGAIGLPAAIGYTWLIMAGLRTWWVGAVGTTAMHLHVEPLTLVYGLVGSLLVAFCAILWAVWRVGRTPASRLLAGGWGAAVFGKTRPGRIPRIIAIIAAIAGLAVLAMGASGKMKPQDAFLSGGGILLCASLFWLGGTLRPGRRHEAGAGGVSSVTRLGVRNASRHTARSVLSVGLIAFAAFTLITVAAMREGEPGNTADPHSGAGGYQLMVESGIPLLGDPGTIEGRKILGFREPAAGAWDGTKFVPMRRWAGQDISCLNLTRPGSPTVLGVPQALAAEGGFTFTDTHRDPRELWALLEQGEDAAGNIPVIADANTAEYILHMSIGQTIDVNDAAGRPRHLKLVAMLAHSIFQSELLMGEGNFRKTFPTESGFGVVLVRTPAGQVAEVRKRLTNELDEYAVTVETTASRLATYQEIENTYLSTFQTLGALGLMLGTIGLAVVLVRTVIERRAELALLATLGFRPGDRVRLVLAENAFLLLLGLGVGAGCALIGILPNVIASARGIQFGAMAITLAGVLLTGIVSSVLAVWLSGIHTTPADLRRE